MKEEEEEMGVAVLEKQMRQCFFLTSYISAEACTTTTALFFCHAIVSNL